MSDHSDCVAIIGLACRFPGARTPQAFWHNLRAGVESISFLSDQELEAAGVASAIYNAPGYVKAASELEGVDRFDAEFFGFNPREAELTDPQHRQFLEVAHEALEVAGYDPGRFDGSISVFAGAYANTYVQAAVLPNRHRLASTIDPLQLIVANDKDYLPTLVSYKLNLRGPSIGVQAACSTSLVAVHLACQSLMLYQCDLALAGAASVKVPQRQGYFYREGGLLSPDGHCRPFDADAQGTIFGSGVGVVVLKRLEEAIADGDTIEAVILGSAINNDGARKAAFTAPGVVGQEEVTATAHHLAEVDPETISFIEAHGTGTPLGDSVEIAALKAAFATTAKHRFCALGSVKSNFGHLDAAAGIAGLIKTVLSLKHDLIPPSLHYRRPNPEMRLEDSPFYVNTELAEWPANGERRRAGVSSFGIGGTNAHVVLEQAPAVPASIPATACQLLVLSARTGSALDAATARLADHLRAHPDLNPADVAYTLQVGRRAFAHRRMLVCRDLEAAVAALANGGERLRSVRRASETPAAVILLFPDAGAEYPGMGAELYRAWLVFREQIDRCAEILGAQRGSEVRSTLRAAFGEVSGQPIPPWAALPMLFATEYALARLWTSWGVRPTAMIGHGLGEYVAACLAGVLSLEDALGLALRRGGCAAGDTIAEPIAASVALRPPQIPYVSNVTGTWITPAEATDPEYWSRHLRCRVRFAEGLSALGTGDVAAERVLLEAGPGQTLCALARRHPGLTARAVVPSMRQQQEPQPDQPYLLEALGRLWLQGVEIDWEAVHDGERRRRIALPTYPFEGRRYWIEDAAPARDGRQEPASPQLYERPQETGDYVAPRTEVERTLARIWQALLGIEPVGRNDNFLKLGGHSLLATRLFTRVRQEFKVDLPLRTIFETATLEELARQIEESAAAPAPPPLVAVARCQTLPLSFAQQRLWVLDQLRPGTSFYNIPAGWHLRGPLNVAALGASLDEIVRRHEPLRTRFSVRDGKPYQEISPPAPIPLPIVDLTALAADRREATGVQLATAETRRPFDLARGPVLRNLLLRLGAEEHALLVTVHHIASDAWSMGLFISELQTLHQAFCTGLPAGLPKLPVQYADFSIWQRSWLTGAVLEEELAWWARRLRGAAGVELPGDRPRPALQAPRGRRLSFQLTRPLSDALHKLGQEHGATLYMTLLAAFQTLIYGYTGQSDVVVGSPVANRNHPLLERMIGFFVNMLAMRSDLSGNPSFEKLLAQVVEMTLDSFRNQDLPFEKVVDLLLPERDLSRNPIFQLVLAVQNAPMPKADMGELSVAISTDSQLTRFDLEFHLRPGPAGLHGLLAYDGHLFDATTIRRLAGHFRHLLEGIVEDPSRRLGELPLMDAAERWQMVAEWNCAQADYDRDVCLHELFEAQAARRPQAVAVVCGDRTLRYGELNDRANRLAHRLIALGVRAEKMVGVCIEPSLEMVVALLAVLKAGGAYVPIDPDYPAERIGFILRDVAASALLTRSWIVSELGEIGTVPLCLDEEDFAEYPATDPPRRAGSDQTAYVIFTSGSTGRPKGVILQHRPVVNLIEWVNHTFAVGPADRVLMVASMCFDLSVYDVFGLLAAGGSTHVATGEEIRDPEALVQLLDSGTVTFWDSAPAALNQLVPFLPAPGRGSRSLRLAFLSGDWIPLTLQPAMVRAFPALRVIGLGGATEAAVWSNFHAIDEVRPEWLSIPYGVAIQNARYYVLDARLQPCPLGVAGDLYIGGECLSWGYYRRPQLTAERYVPDPSSDRPGGVLYTTGDRARWRTAGYLEFLGRLDTQVKIRGYRIELGEIEAALREHGAVRQVVAMVREDQPGNRRLVAYAVADSTGTAEQLRQLLQRRLPGYMVPSAIVILDSLPLTPNGKVDRRALPVPERVHEEPEALGAGPQPRTPAEQQLVRIVGELLGNERVGVEDNFFELGGDSILGIQLVSRARDAGLEISPRQVFESPTIGDLAALVESAAAVASPPVRRVAQRARDLPLLPAQLWFLELDRADPHHFNQSLLLTTPATLRHQHLMRAIDELRRCHQALALRFLPQGLAWRQRYEPPAAPAPCHRIDLSALPSAARAPVLTAAAAVLQAGLSLSTGPIFRAAHFVLGAGQPGRLLLIGHHLAVDGVSWRILLADLETACRQLERGVVPELPPPAVSLGDWGERLAEHGRSEALAAEADGWLAQRYRRCSALPQDLPDGVNDEASARRLLLSPAAGQTRKLLQDVPRAARVQLEEVLLAALAETLSRWAGGGPVLVDLEGHGREPLGTDVDLSRTVGWFTSIYPVVLEPDENAAPGATLRRVKETLRRMPHRGIGYGVLCYLGQDRALARRLRELPRPEVIFNYFGQLDPGLSRSSLLEPAPEFVGAVRSPRALRSHRHEINAHVSGGQLTIAWTWSANLHREATIRQLADDWLANLRTLIDHCLSPAGACWTPSDFPLAGLGQETLDRLLAGGPRIEDLHPLSPLQQGMLFHSLRQPESGEYVEQLSFRLTGPLAVDALEQAWSRTLDNHTALRSAFAWEGLEEPLQMVCEEVEMPWRLVDWRGRDEDVQQRLLAELMAADRAQGFELKQAPLMRMTLVMLAEDRHQLLWSFHHLLLDGWSMPLVLRELFERYDALERGRQPQLLRGRPYRDYVAWLRGQDLSRAERYWRRLLGDFDRPTVLPLAPPPAPAAGEDAGGRLQRPLDRARTEALEALARRHRLTLNTLTQGAWALLLSRYCDCRDVVFGVVVSGRSVPLPGIESMVGLLINTLPLRVRLADGDRLVPWLEQVQARQLEIQEFAYTPLVRIQGWSAVPRGQALFQSIQAFENYPRGDQASDDAGGRIEGLEFRERANYPLGLIVVPGGPLVVELDYDRGLFGDAEAKRLLGHLEQLLVGMTAATDKPLAALSLLSPAERRQVLHDWNRTRSPYSHDRCLHELVEEQAARGPSRVAVTFAGRHLTCRELHLRSNRLAHYLKRRGVGPEVVAGICLPRSLDLVVAVLGVLKAGGAFLPLDPTYPRERLAFMVADAAVPVLVTVAQLAELLPEHAAERVLVDVEAAAIAEQSAATPAGGAGPDNLAYVIYTSGSTGRPKGVMVPHRGLCNAAQLRIFGLRPEDRLLQFWAFSFDAAVAEIAMALRVGATLVLARPEAMLPGPELIGLLREQGITVLHLPPAALATLPDEPLPAARLVITGGEVVSAELVARWAPGRSFRNIYGPTESTIWTSSYRCVDGTRTPPIGRPIANLRTYVLDCRRQPLPVGAPGELHAGGVGVTRGYLRRPALTAERFGPDPWSGESGARLYRTGDRVRLLADGNLEFLGRVDEQMKIRGFRIEPGEIEAVLAAHPDVRQAAVVVRTVAGDRRLTAYVVAGEPAPERDALRAFVAERLPEHMVPAAFVRIEALPLSPAGKVDRRALATMETAELERSTAFHAPTSELEQAVAAVWQEVLGIEKVGLDDNFFDLGGHSLLLVRLHGELRQRFEADLSQIDLFDKPTVRALAEHLGGATVPVPALTTPAVGAVENAVAVIGMAGRFPGARNLDELWRNLRDGVESIRTFSDEEALAAGVSRERLARPDLVKAAGVLDEPDYFDAAFFGIPPREADLLDPQQRIFLELAWEALENAGYAAGGVRIGVYAGVENSTYLTSHLATHPDLAKQVSYFQVMLLNNRDFLPTRVSYKLGLRGPSVNVQTACSTSLVAIHHACRSLLDGECDLVLAGGVSIRFPQQAGYLHQEGGILSPDGHCRPFDAGAAGTVSGNGAGIVVLKRLDRALADGDTIRAVVKGSAINNDGSGKVGFTAPSIDGQAEVVAAALQRAGAEPGSITLIEAHGSGTELGDPIEIAALTRAFGATERKGFCAVGAVKSNIGHLDSAAGVAGLIKTVLALEHKVLPPSLNFERPNPKIDFAAGPFYVNTEARPWPAGEGPRRAGVSSFGLGGTNAHAVLEEAPPPPAAGVSRSRQLLVLSARTAEALEAATDDLARHLEQHPEIHLADVAFTLQVGRRAFAHRRTVTGESLEQVAAALADRTPGRVLTGTHEGSRRPLAFMFPGQGVQYPNMGGDLYRAEPLFRDEIDRCAELLEPSLELDLRRLLFPGDDDAEASRQLARTAVAQPALFAFEYALARLWIAWGVRPQALIGHSVGEYVAACLAGVFELPDALRLVAERGRMMQQLPQGVMLAVPLPEDETLPLLDDDLSLASLNSPSLSVVSGKEAAVAALEQRLIAEHVQCMRLNVGPAGHSHHMDALVEPFAERVGRLRLRPPEIPFLSGVTGDWITAAEATDPSYWAQHMRRTARFAPGLERLLREPRQILLEVGPGQNLSSIALQHLRPEGGQTVLSSLSHPQSFGPLRAGEPRRADDDFLLTSLGKLWLAGVEVDWTGFHGRQKRRRIPLPTHPFERRRYWVARPAQPPSPVDAIARQLTQLTREIEELRRAQTPAPAPAGALPLLPIQQWFFERHRVDADTFAMAMLLRVRPDVGIARVEAALRQVMAHHESLRLRFAWDGKAWWQHTVPAESAPLVRIDLRTVGFSLAAVGRKRCLGAVSWPLSELRPSNGGWSALAAVGARLQAALDPVRGPLLRAAWIDLGGGEPARLLIAVHHLAVDLPSWWILRQDLNSLCRRPQAVLPPPTASFRQWVGRLAEYARSPRLAGELDYWRAAVRTAFRIPVDRPGGANVVASEQVVQVTLDEQESRLLSEDLPRTTGARLGEIVLAALAGGLAAWTGSPSVVVDVEGHGREDLFADLDLSRTTGWLTCLYPLRLEAGSEADPEAVLTRVRDEVRRVPDGGVGYGILRRLSPDSEIAAGLRPEHEPEVGFNFLGRQHPIAPAAAIRSEPLEPAAEPVGPGRSPGAGRPHLLEIEATLTAGALRLAFRYSDNLHHRRTIEELAQRVLAAARALATAGRPRDAAPAVCSVADFPAADLSSQELAAVLDEIE